MITEEQINKTLKEKIDILVKGIVDALPVKPQAIYLVGGYGRGEGAWYEDESGLHPYNDFDIAVITDNPLDYDNTETIRKQLAKSVGIKWVDIDYYSLQALSSLTSTIHNVDLLKGGCLIYGEDVIKQNRLNLDEQAIGKQDLIILYWTRMWTFLGSWEGEFRHLSTKESRFFKNQMAKAILAACDMRLVKLHRYTTSYRKRADIILEKYKDDKSLCELVTWAINEKMRPSSCEMGNMEMQKLYFRVKDEFIKAFDYSFGEQAHFFLNPDETKNYYLWHTKSYLYHLYSLIRHHKSRVVKGLDVFYAMNYVFHSNNNGCINSDYLNKASALLQKQGYIEQPDYLWNDLRILVANARNNV